MNAIKDEFYFVTRWEHDPLVYKAVKQQDDTYVVSWVENDKPDNRTYPQYEVEESIKVGAWQVSDKNGVVV